MGSRQVIDTSLLPGLNVACLPRGAKLLHVENRPYLGQEYNDNLRLFALIDPNEGQLVSVKTWVTPTWQYRSDIGGELKYLGHVMSARSEDLFVFEVSNHV